MSNVRKIVCHAEFTCLRCGKPFLAMAVAPWEDGKGVTGDADRTRDLCNDCERSDRDAESAERDKAMERQRWAKKHAVTVPADPSKPCPRCGKPMAWHIRGRCPR